ncbi:uncharacterized protein DS421_16g546040 [Arachis hypogaea]|nr:uncharacterized protein DS421_16g546040 [Arachis hypogaea]
MRPGRMWNGDAGPPIDSGRRPTRIATVAQAGPSIGPRIRHRCDCGRQRAPLACFGTCALRASAVGSPFGPS